MKKYEYTKDYALILLKKVSKQLYNNFKAYVEHNDVEFVRLIVTENDYELKKGTWLGVLNDKNVYLEV